MLYTSSLIYAGSKGLTVFLGIVVLSLAAGVFISGGSIDNITGWTLKVFGTSFLILLAFLMITVCVCWVRLIDGGKSSQKRAVLLETAEHAANGTATLALTYTLLGISLGISSLAGKELNTNTIQSVIGGLTDHFSMAFMTTVVGLPISAVLRALIGITEKYLSAVEDQSKEPNNT